MGVGHGRHSKQPDAGSNPGHVEAELRAALLALREVKKALARADTRFRQISPEKLPEVSAWAAAAQTAIDVAQRTAAGLKTTIDAGLARSASGAPRAPHGVAIDAAQALVASAAESLAEAAREAAKAGEEAREQLGREVDEQIRKRAHRGTRGPKDF